MGSGCMRRVATHVYTPAPVRRAARMIVHFSFGPSSFLSVSFCGKYPLGLTNPRTHALDRLSFLCARVYVASAIRSYIRPNALFTCPFRALAVARVLHRQHPTPHTQKVNAELAETLRFEDGSSGKKSKHVKSSGEGEEGGGDGAVVRPPSLLQDDRFAALFANPDFQIDMEVAVPCA